MKRYSLRSHSATSTPPPKKAKIVKTPDGEASQIVPSKSAEAKKVLAGEKVRLDYLVIEKCVAHMHQPFYADFVHENVSRQFAMALKSVHGRISILMKVDCVRHEIELQNVVPKRLFVHKNAVPFKVIIKLQAGNNKYLGTVLTKLFDRFKKIKGLTIHRVNEPALTELTNVVRKANGVRFRRLDINTDPVLVPFCIIRRLPSSFRDVCQLLLCIAPQIKELWLEGSFSVGATASRQFWETIAACSCLRHLKITDVGSFDNDYSKKDLVDCLKALKITRFQANGFCFFFDSAAAMLSAFESNANLRHLRTNGGPTFFSSPLLQPILRRLHSLTIDALINDLFAESDPCKREMISILPAMSTNRSALCIRLVIIDDDTDENMLNIFKMFLQLSKAAKKPIELVFRSLLPGGILCFPTADDVADLVEICLIEADHRYRNLSVIRYGAGHIYELNGAEVIMSVAND